MKNLYCVVGKSGVGKDTIVNELCRTYGYSRVISSASDQVDKNDLYIIDWRGYQELKKSYKSKPIKLIVINADKEVRCARMRKRGDADADIDKRIVYDDEVFEDIVKAKSEIDIIISNNHDGNIKGICKKLHKEIQKIENPLTETVDAGVKLYNPWSSK